MAGLLAAELDAVGAHSSGDIAVADRGDFNFDIVILSPVEEALVGHDGDGEAVEAEIAGEESEDLVAVDEIALFIYHNTAIAVAVVGDATG